MPTTVDINFTGAYTPPVSNAVNLNFGPPPTLLPDDAFLAIGIEKARPEFVGELSYDANFFVPFGPNAGLGWEETDRSSRPSLALAWQTTEHARVFANPEWTESERLQVGKAIAYQFAGQLRIRVLESWQEAVRVPMRVMDSGYQFGVPIKVRKDSDWQKAQNLADVNRSEGYKFLTRERKLASLLWEETRRVQAVRNLRAGAGVQLSDNTLIPWQEGRKPPPGGYVYVPPVIPNPALHVPNYDLNFQCPWVPVNPLAVLLNFGPYACMWAPSSEIPVRKVYFIVNNVSMKRVSDDLPITLKSVSVGLDNASKMWSLTASIPRSHLERVEPTLSGPVEVELAINGLVWRFLVEEYDSSRQFASGAVSIRGRSVTAYLDAPYAPTRSFAQTDFISSRAFAEAELTRPGLVTGFTLDWALIDPLGWGMPADTWSYSDLTPLQVIQQLVEGAGGYVSSHPSSRVVQVRAEYPSPYWEWSAGTADIVIPKSAVSNQTLRWSEKPQYNGVFVTGENTGVTALVRRLGTPGDLQAPLYVSPMISDAAAARQKGLSILSAGGRQAEVTLELPLLSGLGLVTPGLLIEVTNGGADSESAWRGLVRGVGVSASFRDGLVVQQSITLERHYGGL